MPLLWVICYPVPRIDIAYLCKKFEDFRLSHSSDLIGAFNIFNGSRPDHVLIRDVLSSVGCDLHIQPVYLI